MQQHLHQRVGVGRYGKEEGVVEVGLLQLLAIGVGACLGSFLALAVQRLPRGEPVILARSRCRVCGHVLQPVDLVPVISWLVLRGRCRRCDAAIGASPLAFEVVGALAGALVFHIVMG